MHNLKSDVKICIENTVSAKVKYIMMFHIKNMENPYVKH